MSASDVQSSLPAAQESGPRIGAVSRRVPILARPSPGSPPIGLVTAGATVARGDQPVGRDGCVEGWYRVLPRGYLCLNEKTTLDPNHPTLQARGLAANREAPLPYPYATAKQNLVLFEADPKRQDGVRERGRLSRGSTFAVVGTWNTLDEYDQLQRLALLTLGTFVSARDIEPVKYASSPGLFIDGTTHHMPLALPNSSSTPWYRFVSAGPTKVGSLDSTRPIALTVKSRTSEGMRFLMRPDESYVAESDVTVVRQRQEFPAFVKASTHWVDIDVNQGLVVMYVGEHPSYVTRTRFRPSSTTPRGAAWVRSKHISDLSSNANHPNGGREQYDVPWIVELDSGVTLQGAMATTGGAPPASAQQVDLYPEDAAKLFRFVEPNLPEGWHGVIVADPRQEGSPVLLR